MAKIRIAQLIPSSDDILFAEQSRKLRQLRLDSLRLNPNNFSSKYADEVNQPTHFWHNRLRNPDAQHWIATSDYADDAPKPVNEQWVGFLVFVKQSLEDMPSIQSQTRGTENANICNYYMSAAYVDARHRGCGVCTSLIQTAIRWVTEQTRDAKLTMAFITTRVRAENINAKKLYEYLGFKLITEDAMVNSDGDKLPSFFLQLTINL